jgi:hypothetical protein
MSTAQNFADALLDRDAEPPPGLSTWNGSDPAHRFSVYRNNVMVSLIDALADSYPVTQALVGESFFRAMARLFVIANLPRSPVLAWYGEGFGDFIGDFPPASSVPYLADMARLELARVRAYHAADVVPLTVTALSKLLTDTQRLPDVRFSLHPSLYAFRSAYAVISLWRAHQAQSWTENQDDALATALAEIDPAQPEDGLVLRSGLDVTILAITPGAAEFILALQQGIRFGDATAHAVTIDTNFDLTATLGHLLQAGTITHAESFLHVGA